MMEILVITGGIGSGKSEVCRILRGKGLGAQYNADSRVKALYAEHPTLLSDIEKALGCRLRDSDGKFLSSKMAEVIFSDRNALETIESLVFPALMDDFSSFAAMHSEENILIFESATVLEKPAFEGFGDKVILVDAPYSIRLARACGRDGAAPEAVAARMANQKLMNALSEGYEDPRIDAVIMNDSGLEELEERTSEAMSQLFDNKNFK